LEKHRIHRGQECNEKKDVEKEKKEKETQLSCLYSCILTFFKINPKFVFSIPETVQCTVLAILYT
jgi:hypothetical protein